MASGVGVDEDLVELVQSMKLNKKYRCVIIKFEEVAKGSPKKVIEDCRIYPKEDQTEREEFDMIVANLPEDDVRYLLFDLMTYKYDGAIPVEKYNDELLKKLQEGVQKQVLVVWAPQGATMRKKMLISSSTDAIKKKIYGKDKHFEVDEKEDLNYFKFVLKK